MSTLEIRWTKTVTGKTIVCMEDGSPSYSATSETASDFQLDEVIDPDGGVDFDRDELLDFIIDEHGP